MHASKKVAKIPTRTLEKIQKVATGGGESIFWSFFGSMQSLGNVYGRVRHEKMNCCFSIFPGGLVNLKDK